jgi:GAF domain-containing protein
MLLHTSIAGEILQIKKPLLIDDYPSHPKSNPAFIEAGVKTLLAAPLKLRDKTIGVIGVFRKTPHPFKTKNLHALNNLTPHTTLAIMKAKQYAELERIKEQEEERVAEQTEELRRTQQALLNLIEDLSEEKQTHA